MKTYDRYDVTCDGDVSQLYVAKTEHDAELAKKDAEIAELKAELAERLDTTRELYEYYKNQSVIEAAKESDEC